MTKGKGVQSSLFKRDLLKQDFGLSGTFLLPFNPISIQIAMVERDLNLIGTA
jgi:hypothetical protein